MSGTKAVVIGALIVLAGGVGWLVFYNQPGQEAAVGDSSDTMMEGDNAAMHDDTMMEEGTAMEGDDTMMEGGEDAMMAH